MLLYLRFSCRTHVHWGLRKAIFTLPVSLLVLSSFFDSLGLPHSLWGLFNIPPLKSHITSSCVPPQTQKSCQALFYSVWSPVAQLVKNLPAMQETQEMRV